MLWQKSESGDEKLFIIDGVGNSDFIPLTNYISVLRLMKISRKWNRFERQLYDRYNW